MLLSLGDPNAAAGEYAKALQLQPGRSAALLGSARTEGTRGRAAEAKQAYRQLAGNWSAADVTVPALAEVRQHVARP